MKTILHVPITIEQADGNLSAFSCAFPGCVATASSKDELLIEMNKSLTLHLKGEREFDYIRCYIVD